MNFILQNNIQNIPMFLWNLTIKRNGNENETILRPLLINGQGNHEFIHSRIVCELRVPQNIGVKMGGVLGWFLLRITERDTTTALPFKLAQVMLV